MNIYLISGLGADCSIFDQLTFPENTTLHKLEWDMPSKDDTLESYALKMSKNIIERNATLIGLSFGGMIATEIAKYNPQLNVILISSIPVRSELPKLYDILLKLHLDRLINEFSMKKLSVVVKKILYRRSNNEMEQKLHAMLQNTDVSLFKWSIRAIYNWNNTQIPSNIKRIHGTNDNILPLQSKTVEVVIPKGSHVMVLENANTISKSIDQLILQFNNNNIEAQ